MVAALIIASGKTLRKDQFEPQKELGTITAVQRIAMVFQRAGVERIVVVCGEYGDKTEKLAAHMNLVFLHSPQDAEMLDNVKTGITYLQGKCSSVLISHVDVPLFTVETIHMLMMADGDVRIPSYHGRRGHPLFLRMEHAQNILTYTGEDGVEGAIRTSGLQQHIVVVEDEGVLANIQRDEPYAHLVAAHDLMQIHPEFTFRLTKERAFYDPDTHQLLQLTIETGSLRDACRHMGISYTKGRAIISNLEQQMGYPILESQQGGKTGGFSLVTDEARTLMRCYDNFCSEAAQCLHVLFKKHFP